MVKYFDKDGAAEGIVNVTYLKIEYLEILDVDIMLFKRVVTLLLMNSKICLWF